MPFKGYGDTESLRYNTRSNSGSGAHGAVLSDFGLLPREVLTLLRFVEPARPVVDVAQQASSVPSVEIIRNLDLQRVSQ